MAISVLSHAEARAAVVDAARALFTNGVMSHSGHANLSARVGGEAMLLTVEGQVRGLGPDGLALVRLDGTVLEGTLDPGNAEIITMHSEVYKARPQVGGIIHTHSPHLLAFAMAGRPLPDRYEALLRFGQAEEVPVVPWAPISIPAARARARRLAADRPAAPAPSTTTRTLTGHLRRCRHDTHPAYGDFPLVVAKLSVRLARG
jgi:ribulose-5-phosphate 4-epimerase/fuculose-1-phosphate aldolase